MWDDHHGVEDAKRGAQGITKGNKDVEHLWSQETEQGWALSKAMRCDVSL